MPGPPVASDVWRPHCSVLLAILYAECCVVCCMYRDRRCRCGASTKGLPVALLHYSASRSHLFAHCRLDRVCSPRRPVALPLALPPALHAAAALHCPTLRCDALRAEPLRSACERCASWRRVEAANVERVLAAFAAQQLAVAVAHAAPAPHHTSAPCELRLPIRADAIRSNRIEWDGVGSGGIRCHWMGSKARIYCPQHAA
jgi:hypothetical protein